MKPVLTVNEAWQILDALVPGPLPAEHVSLDSARGRVLREPVFAPEDQPAFDRASIDGYVVPLATAVGAPLRLGGSIPMGAVAPAPPAPGEAIRLHTGSAVPSGEVGLVMWEDVVLSPDGASLTLRAPARAELIRRRASQARAGDPLLAAGGVLGPGAIALLASAGRAVPRVSRRPRVAHLVTGGELVPVGQSAPPGCIRDSNTPLVAALLAEAGAELVAHVRAGETHAAASAAFGALLALEPDLLLVSGGSSRGEHDHAARLFAEHGFRLAVDQVASRPGKPLLVAARGAQLAAGLPGNPLSHFVCFHLFVARLLARLQGASPAPLLRLPLVPGAPLLPDHRETWWPASRETEGYAPLPWRDSSDLTTLADVRALIRVPARAEVDGAQAEGMLV